MTRPYLQIPDWYAKDWNPARGRGELPQMTWTDLEMTLPQLLATQAQRERAVSLTRALWLESVDLEPMALLQQMLWISAHVFMPARTTPAPLLNIPTPAFGPLPRWSYTDVEVALSYTWKDQALLIAQERYRDLLAFRGEGETGATTARRLFLLVSGLPWTSAKTERKPTLRNPGLSAAA